MLTKLSFIGDVSQLAEGLALLKDDLKFTICDAELGLQVKAAYDKGDKEKLLHIVSQVLPELLISVTDLKDYHRNIWMQTNKTLGWETYDLRYGILMNRIDTAIYRLKAFCSGVTDHIDELDEPRRYYHGEPNLTEKNCFAGIASAGRFLFYTMAVFPM